MEVADRKEEVDPKLETKISLLCRVVVGLRQLAYHKPWKAQKDVFFAENFQHGSARLYREIASGALEESIPRNWPRKGFAALPSLPLKVPACSALARPWTNGRKSGSWISRWRHLFFKVTDSRLDNTWQYRGHTCFRYNLLKIWYLYFIILSNNSPYISIFKR